MIDHYEAKLRWVLVDGEPHNVSDFADLAPQARPQAFCPICAGPVVLKLGKVRVHHCAHPPNSDCAATQPETIIHLNSKLHIYRQLLTANKLLITEECTRHRWLSYNTEMFLSEKELQAARKFSCIGKREHVWLQAWDRVEVEYRVGSRRPDIALLSNGKVIGAIEVFVSHAVDDEKAAYLKELNIPWLEIIGQESLYNAETAWTSDKHLPIHRMQPKNWVCDGCIKIQQIEKEYQNTQIKTHAAKLVDYYFPSGKKYRAVYVVLKMFKDGNCIEVRLQDGSEKIIARERGVINEAAMKRLTEKFNQHLENAEVRAGAIIDSPMKWDQEMLPKTYEDIDLYEDEVYPFRYRWWKKEEKWFLPKDLKDISWDK